MGDGDDIYSISKYILTSLSDGNLTYGSNKNVLLIRRVDGEEYVIRQ